jgi:hypothetical protein
MTILNFKDFGELDELKNAVEYIIDDNELISNFIVYENNGIITITIDRRDPKYYKIGNINCPSNQESANWVSELCDVVKQHDIPFRIAVYFSYTIDEFFKSLNGTFQLSGTDILFINREKLENIEDSIIDMMVEKNEKKFKKHPGKNPGKIDDIIITRFELDLFFSK